MKVGLAQYNLLYDIYSWPNIILAFCGGVLIDRVFGIRKGGIIFSFIVMISQVVLAIGALTNQFWLMVVGRFIFAFGGESLSVVQNTYLVKWFNGKELNFVFGFTLSFARVGSTVTMNLMKPIYNSIDRHVQGHTCLGITMLIATVFTLFSWACAFILAYFDRRRDEYSRLISRSSEISLQAAGAEPNGKVEETVKITHILVLPLGLWIMCFVCVAYYTTVFPFVSNAQLFFISKYKLSPQHADVCNSLIYMISIVMSPVCGVLVDQTGRNIMWMIISALAALLEHFLLAFTMVTPYFLMVIAGVSYSLLASCFWPCVSYIVPNKVMATAYGVVTSVQNLGMALVYLYIGDLIENAGYFVLEIHFIAWLSGKAS
ncbi:unnamed protein product [Soboliphyme baturini]|uniref:Lysosomal dipeptide transporter MFSD1 n=1 Tax=Soboliphyme baturini TaxID=241478 RepID=A0A183IK82_9BILA|nr:unnamed protein product [Soboliphyme baturini]